MTVNPDKNNLLANELTLIEKGVSFISGTDEVGRGALAGPLVVASVILNRNHLIDLSKYLEKLSLTDADSKKRASRINDVSDPKTDGSDLLVAYSKINDSKVVTPKLRERLSRFIIANAVCYSIVEVSHTKIDSDGISASTQRGFRESIAKLSTQPDFILTDAFPIKAINVEQRNIIHGDKISISIAAASIVAKVYRDSLMIDLGTEEPYKPYCFVDNKGYGTQKHISAIKELGVSDIHRKTFVSSISSPTTNICADN